jgi:hypothetical protein
MARYVLRFKGGSTSRDHARERIAKRPDVEIVDEAPRMLLVEGSPEAINRLSEELPGCDACLERTSPLPDPRPKLRSQ